MNTDKLALNWQNLAQVRLQPKFAFIIRPEDFLIIVFDDLKSENRNRYYRFLALPTTKLCTDLNYPHFHDKDGTYRMTGGGLFFLRAPNAIQRNTFKFYSNFRDSS